MCQIDRYFNTYCALYVSKNAMEIYLLLRLTPILILVTA